MSESLYGGGVYGRQLVPAPSPEQIARAREAEIEQARRVAPELPFESFEIRETAPGKVVFVDRRGAQFRRADFDPLADPSTLHLNPHGIVGFVVDRGQRVHYLVPRGQQAVPSRIVSHGPFGGRQLVPGEPLDTREVY
jgi:hypothetical protein